MTNGPYARIYHAVMDDEKFDGIREDVRLFGSWALCLVVADMAYPAPAYVPPTVPRSAFTRLCEAGLIDPMDGHRFRVHGLQSERERRSSSARVGGLASGRSRSVERSFNDSSRTQRTETNLAEQSKARAEPSIAREGLRSISDPVAKAWQRATGRPFLAAGAFALDYLESVCERHPEAAVLEAIGWAREQFHTAPTSQQLAVMVRGRLDPLPDAKAAAKAGAVQRESERGRRAVQATKSRAHDTGFHADEPDPACDRCRGAA